MPLRCPGASTNSATLGSAQPVERGTKMFEEIQNRKSGLGYVWIRSESGTTYLCPASAVVGMTSATDEELSAIGVDESFNPQND